MLRVGLTGGLGSGKTTVSRIFAELGAFVLSADEVGRRLMQPGEEVYAAIVREFGKSVIRSDGSLDRKALAELAFRGDRAPALNRIVHPATVAAEKEWMSELGQHHPTAVAIVESALIFEVEKWGTAPGWPQHFDKLILVTAPDEVKIDRVVTRAMSFDTTNPARRAADPARRAADPARRAALEKDARARLALQIPDEEKLPCCDFVIRNDGAVERTRAQVEAIYLKLKAAALQLKAASEQTQPPSPMPDRHNR